MSVIHRNVAVLRVADPGVLDEIRAVYPALDVHILGWIAPTEAVLDPSELKPLLDAFVAMGMGALVRRTGTAPA